MFDVHKPKQKPITIIRAATGAELSEYEKRKLANIEESAQENKIEVVSLNIAGDKQRIDPINKEVEIKLGSLAIKSNVTGDDISQDDIFIIKCELDQTMLGEQN